MGKRKVESRPARLPCVVQVGFAGSRRLFAIAPDDETAADAWNVVVVHHLIHSLDELKTMLGLSGHHFLCGISQIAIGGDMLFARALQNRGESHRVLIPQALGEYLTATEPDGTPDFDDGEIAEAHRHLSMPSIIQVKCVSESNSRDDRFRKTNAEILRIADVVVSLVRDDDDVGQAGGTNEFIRRAVQSGKPALEIRVSIRGGKPICNNFWHLPKNPPYPPPANPPIIDQHSLLYEPGNIPAIDEFCSSLKEAKDRQSLRISRLFKYAAALIILTHIAATVLATMVLASKTDTAPTKKVDAVETSDAETTGQREPSQKPELQTGKSDHRHSTHGDHGIAIWLLTGELILLVAGISIHLHLDHSNAARKWAKRACLSRR